MDGPLLNTILLLLASVIWTEAADRTVHPRGPRVWTARAFATRLGACLIWGGAILAITGDGALAFGGTALAATILAAGSNLKYRHLGEPLVFSDLAYIGTTVRHPRLYIGVLPRPMRVIVVLLPVVVVALLVLGQSDSVRRHTAGAMVMLLGVCAAGWALWRRSAVPDLAGDVSRDGLIATLVRYWVSWRGCKLIAPVPPVLSFKPDGAEIVVVVQCESFVDPADLPGAPLQLPALDAARARAELSGRLMIDGFGAYTMRTEFGVMTGIEAGQLGFGRFDPFVRGAAAARCALGTRFAGAGFDTQFIHPFELGFYGRDRLMPALGFEQLIGRGAFAFAERHGPYASDPALGAFICERVKSTAAPVFIYAVTMENHGPWAPPKGETALDAYRRHLLSSDTMLAGLLDHLDASARPMLLVFFGDHRPSIPGQIDPGPVRHTPYVIVSNRRGGDHETRDLTPAELNHAVIRHAEGTSVSTADPREAAAASSAPVI